MDVSATGPAVAAAVPQASVETITGTVATPAPPQPAPVASSPNASQSAIPPTQTTPAPIPGAANRSAIAPAIAKLFGNSGPPEPIRLDVSYRVLSDPNVIVTVFSDPKTGQEVAQFPPELLIHLAQFFDQPRGVTLDRNA
jgi:hypothetical protein